MDEMSYLVNSGAWSVGGFLLGYVVGRIRREVREVHEKVVRDDEDAK